MNKNKKNKKQEKVNCRRAPGKIKGVQLQIIFGDVSRLISAKLAIGNFPLRKVAA